MPVGGHRLWTRTQGRYFLKYKLAECQVHRQRQHRTLQTKATHPVPGYKLKFLTLPRIEPGSPRWKAGILRTTPRRWNLFDSLKIFWYIKLILVSLRNSKTYEPNSILSVDKSVEPLWFVVSVSIPPRLMISGQNCRLLFWDVIFFVVRSPRYAVGPSVHHYSHNNSIIWG